MTPEFWISIATLIGAVIVTPLLVAYISRSGKRTDAEAARLLQQQTWARQDAVADKVEQVRVQTEIVAKQAEIAAKLLVENQETVAAVAKESAKDTSDKLTVIHTLVNDKLTATIKKVIAATLGKVDALEALDRAMPSPETKAAILAARAEIADDEATLKERATAQGIAEKQEKAALLK